MAVYVDEAKHEFGSMLMCHMIADSTEELIGMARTIGVNVKWIQGQGTTREHFDVCKSKRKLAVKNGAIEVTARELATMTLNRRRLVKRDLIKENRAAAKAWSV